jgi:hypothetical protein
MKASEIGIEILETGAPGEIRTPDHRGAVLYPTELRARVQSGNRQSGHSVVTPPAGPRRAI